MSSAVNNRSMCSMLYVAFLVLIINQLANEPLVSAGKDKGDDIILAKGKIILRGGKGKGNIILDPGHSSDGGHHEMPSMMPMMGHFNPYAFYPMQHHQPQLMIRPIYIEDHSHMQQQQHQHHHMEEHHEPQHHEQHQYHHEEPHHYEPQHHEVEQHHEEHHEQPHYEHGGEEHQQQHHEGYEHPIMSLLSMHGSGPQPIYQPHQGQQQQQLQSQPQQHIVMQAYQQPTMYAQLSPEQQAAAYQQAQYMAAEQEAAMRQHQQQHQELQQGQSSEVSSHSPADGAGGSSSSSSSSAASVPSKATNPVAALLEKSANNPLIKRIKPLFKRNKDQKDSSQKKPDEKNWLVSCQFCRVPLAENCVLKHTLKCAKKKKIQLEQCKNDIGHFVRPCDMRLHLEFCTKEQNNNRQPENPATEPQPPPPPRDDDPDCGDAWGQQANENPYDTWTMKLS